MSQIGSPHFQRFKASEDKTSDDKRDPQFQPFKAGEVETSYKKCNSQFQPFKAGADETPSKRDPQFQVSTKSSRTVLLIITNLY